MSLNKVEAAEKIAKALGAEKVDTSDIVTAMDAIAKAVEESGVGSGGSGGGSTTTTVKKYVFDPDEHNVEWHEFPYGNAEYMYYDNANFQVRVLSASVVIPEFATALKNGYEIEAKSPIVTCIGVPTKSVSLYDSNEIVYTLSTYDAIPSGNNYKEDGRTYQMNLSPDGTIYIRVIATVTIHVELDEFNNS